jgi:hypothetical protein
VFSRKNIDGRDAQFAARALTPVYKRHLQMVAAMTPSKLFFDVALPVTGYDFEASAFRFAMPGTGPDANYRYTFTDNH